MNARRSAEAKKSDVQDPDELARLAASFRIAILRLARRIRAERSDESLGLSQLSALHTLSRGPLSPTALADVERIQPPSMTRILTALEGRSLIVRVPHPTDRRQSVLMLTEAGREIVAEDHRRRESWLAKRLEQLPSVDRQQMSAMLSILEELGQSD